MAAASEDRKRQVEQLEQLREYFRRILSTSGWRHLETYGLQLVRDFNREELNGGLPDDWVYQEWKDQVEAAKPKALPKEPAASNGRAKLPAVKKPTAADDDGLGGPLTATPLTKIEMRSIVGMPGEKPIWQDCAFELLVGSKGAGKGTYLASLAARVSRVGGGRNVLFVSTEDSAEIDLKPRLVAAKAKIERCFLVNQHVHLPGDVDALKDLAQRIGKVGLLVIDPVANHIPDVRSSNSDAEIRAAISPLNDLANDLACLLIGVRHPGKDRSRGALLSVLGSTAWVDVPRAVVAIAQDDEDKQLRHIQVVAGNRSLNGAGQVFRIDAVDVPGLMEPITKAVALGESSKDVDDLLAAASGRESETKTGQARALILDILDKEHEQESDALDARVAKQAGLTVKGVRKVRTDLSNEGLIKAAPEKDEYGEIQRWKIYRTAAPRP